MVLDATAAFSTAVTTMMRDVWQVHYEMARTFMEKHQYALALNISDAALRTDPGTLLQVAKADALIGLGRYQEAAAELRTYLQYQPASQVSQGAHDLLDKIQSVMGQ
jgi:predicted Zn-dependent protease